MKSLAIYFVKIYFISAIAAVFCCVILRCADFQYYSVMGGIVEPSYCLKVDMLPSHVFFVLLFQPYIFIVIVASGFASRAYSWPAHLGTLVVVCCFYLIKFLALPRRWEFPGIFGENFLILGMDGLIFLVIIYLYHRYIVKITLERKKHHKNI